MEEIMKEIRRFRDERDWMKFHNPKDMAISINIEAGELLEHFQWKKGAELKKYIKDHRFEIADEIADVALYLFELADNLGINLVDAMRAKIVKNGKKYPVSKSRGTSKKYNKL